MRTAPTILVAFLLALGCAGPRPEDPAAEHQEIGPVTGTDPTGPQVTIVLNEDVADSGGIVSGVIQVSIPPGLHAYSQPPTHEEYIALSVEPSSDARFEVDQIEYPSGEIKRFPMLSDRPIGVYEGVIEIPFLVLLHEIEDPQVAISFDVLTQLCDDTSCFPPETHTVSQTVTIRR